VKNPVALTLMTRVSSEGRPTQSAVRERRRDVSSAARPQVQSR